MIEPIHCILCEKDVTAEPHKSIVLFACCQDCWDSPEGISARKLAAKMFSGSSEKTDAETK